MLNSKQKNTLKRILPWIALLSLLLAVFWLRDDNRRPDGAAQTVILPNTGAYMPGSAASEQAGSPEAPDEAPSAEAPLAEVPKYGVFELTLTASGDYSNPYLQMPGDNDTPGFVVGTFKGPGGVEIQLDGFWDGGSTWKIRMAPTVEGDWTYTTASSDAGLNAESGSFRVTASNSRGFLRVDPSRPNHFMWDDGTPFYWAPVSMVISHFDPRNGDGRGGMRRIDDGSFQELAKVRAEQGFNTVHWGFYGFAKPYFVDRTQENEGGAPFTNYDPTTLNPAYFQAGDERIRALIENGIAPHIILGWPDQNIGTSIGHESLKRYWRYAIARYTAYNIIYDLFGEVQEWGGNYLQVANDYAALTRKWDPYDHLLSTHTVPQALSATLLNQEWMDFIILQQPVAATSNYTKYNKPVVNVEYLGYEGEQVNADQLRPMLWGVRMRGAYVGYECRCDSIQAPGATFARYMNDFFRTKTRFWELESRPALFANKPGLADPGKEYIIYLPSGGSQNVNLTSAGGIFEVEWFNPRTGETTPGGEAQGGASRTFTAPDSKDWVLHLTQTQAGSTGSNVLFLPLARSPD